MPQQPIYPDTAPEAPAQSPARFPWVAHPSGIPNPFPDHGGAAADDDDDVEDEGAA